MFPFTGQFKSETFLSPTKSKRIKVLDYQLRRNGKINLLINILEDSVVMIKGLVDGPFPNMLVANIDKVMLDDDWQIEDETSKKCVQLFSWQDDVGIVVNLHISFDVVSV